ncbi:MAG: MerR family transcriptional regulator, partial [Acidimicrobiales bacterium]
MSSRSYLSIGDVLTLLRQEFPDVTISKIRFLESQGLVNPERTPSGYRKFYEHDVERLRWVLRQQRENFLPLKVIKDRLDDDANGAGGAATPAAAGAPKADESAEPAARARSANREEPVLVGQRSTSATSAPATSASERGAPASGA